MSMEFGEALEILLADPATGLLKNLSLQGFTLVPASVGTDLPWKYVMVEAGDAEHRGASVYTVPLKIKTVGDADASGGFSTVKQVARAVHDYFVDPSCALKKYTGTTAKVFGFWIAEGEPERGDVTYTKTLTVTVTGRAI